MLTDTLNLAKLNNGVNPVNAVTPVLATAAIGTSSHALQAKADQLVQMQQYTGQVVAKAQDGTFLVNLSGETLKNLVLKMDLAPQTPIGKTLALQFLKHEPNLTFVLKSAFVNHDAKVQLSKTGHLLGEFILKSEAQGVPKQYQAQQVVTQFPFKASLMAQDLKQALTQSGLFYESHLQSYAQGQTTIQQIKLEPQNQDHSALQQIVYQQLSTLEQQRLSWYGQVWPGQYMQWDVYQHSKQPESQAESQTLDDSEAISSELNLEMPKLGKIKAKLSVINGRLNVQIQTYQATTHLEMQKAKLQLAENLTKHGQILDGLMITQDKA